MGWIKIQLKYLGFLKLFLFEYFIITHSGRRLYQYNEDESFIFSKLFSKYSYLIKPVILMFNINSLSLIKYGVLNKSNNDIFLRINV